MPVLGRAANPRDWDPTRVGLIGLVSLAVASALALNVGDIDRALRASPYRADFAHASGLQPGDPVRISGLTVGSVDRVSIDGTRVAVMFDANGVALGERTRASIKTATVVGGRYLALDPAGSGELERIPLERTSVPYDLTSAIGDLTEDSAELDLEQLAQAMTSVSESLEQTPDSFRGAISGVHKLATVVASRDDALNQLLSDASSVSGALASRSETITSLMNEANEILAELVARRETIHTLLVSTRELSDQVSGAVRDNRKQLKPSMEQLDQVVEVLRKNEESINFFIDHLGGYTRNLGEAVGGGPFFYGFVQNLVPTNLIPVPIQSKPETGGAG